MLKPTEKTSISIACRPRADGLRPGEKFPLEVRKRMREAALACPYTGRNDKRLYFEKLAETFNAPISYIKAQARDER